MGILDYVDVRKEIQNTIGRKDFPFYLEPWISKQFGAWYADMFEIHCKLVDVQKYLL